MKKNKLILGTVQFGIDYGINNLKGKPTSRDVEDILNYAFNNRITILDTAEAYGDSQERIGEYHRKANHKFKIITKFSSLREDLPNNIIDRVKHNLNTLNVESLYCYMFHNFNDFELFFQRFKDELLILKKEGLIKKIGVSLHSNEEIDSVLNFKDVDIIQLPFNLLDNSNQREKTLLKAKRLGVEIHTRSVFLQGLFFKEPNELTGNLIELKEPLKIIGDLAPKELMNDLALNYVYSKPYIKGVLLGVDSVIQLKSNIKCIEENNVQNLISKVDQINVKEKIMLNPSNWIR